MVNRIMRKIGRDAKRVADIAKYRSVSKKPYTKSPLLDECTIRPTDIWKQKSAECYDAKGLSEAKDNIDLSLIVPLYNSEEFLDRLMECLGNQDTTYKYEVILVDDGSEDDTYKLAESYVDSDECFVLVHTKNRGISCARNEGMSLSRGKYLGFVDHDDIVEKTYVQKLLDAAYANDADVVKCAYLERGKICNNNALNISDGMKGEMFAYASYIWGGIYKREVFTSLRFPEGYWYEDMVVRSIIYRMVKRFVNLEDVLYTKVTHNNNASHVIWNNRKPQCVEHLYLIKIIVASEGRFCLSEDIYGFRCILRECSRIMATRISGLDTMERVAVFIEMRCLIERLFCEEYLKDLSASELEYLNCIRAGDFGRWELVSRI